jgi:hypothetical protein
MSETEQPSVPFEELKKFVTDPSRLTAKVMGYKKYHAAAFRRQTVEEVKIARCGSSPDILIAPSAVQEMIDTGRITIRDEPPPAAEPSLFRMHTPSPDAFLAKHGLTRPDKKAPAGD